VSAVVDLVMKSDEKQNEGEKQQKEEEPRRMLFKSDAKSGLLAPHLAPQHQ
jgi:hypothetical protein